MNQYRYNVSSWVRRKFFAPILVGQVCFAIAFFWTILLGAIELDGGAPITKTEFFGFLLLIVVITPVVESLVFGAFLFLIRYRSVLVLMCYALAMCLFGWWAHGSNWASLGKGLSFAVLAGFTYRITEAQGIRVAILLNIAAHMVWNVMAVFVAAIATGLAT